MNKQYRQRFVSLNLKMILAIIVGLALAASVYILCTWVTNYICEIRYLSDEAIEKNVGEAFDSLQEYIEKYGVEATDTEALNNWAKQQEETYIYIWDNYSSIFESGWWGSEGEESITKEELDAAQFINGMTNEALGGRMSRIDQDFEETVEQRIIKFADNEYYTAISVYGEQKVQRTMGYVSLVLCFLTFIVTLLLYNGRLLKRLIFLASEVKRVSDGNLDHEIFARRNDEIGILATGVDNMRTSIMEKHRNEKEAWEANTQLITAMSHDIRTPLTSMIGYLDIIEGKKYENQEQLDRYVSSCREKAFQLKDLSDKLFQYFLVFGNKDSDRNMEMFDANILFQQLLAEHCAELINYGYMVDFRYTLPDINVETDLISLKRLFDNVFSNIMKYADKSEAVVVAAELKEKDICLELVNRIPAERKKVESTRIGLKTCLKICSDLGGSFSYDETDESFCVKISFPGIEISEDAEKDGIVAEGEENKI
ncbi:HAMP domain-containing sensor histidine kinase [Ihubacter sp. rT4E-8]|uniref:HAMP domain-containing sensor histidine kinase n=1 Tax=unclassified Ihubacter TaxID=2633299 RepID=UPI003C7EB66B